MAPTDASSASPDYDALLAAGRALFPGVRIGRPGRSRGYRATTTVLRVLRARWKIDVEGAGNVAGGPAFLVGNHVSALDPLVVVAATPWRVSAFTKVEWFQGRGAVFFRLMGQIPLRRGDRAVTDWAIDMASAALAAGSAIGIYPEGSRSPDPTKLHRIHGRVLLPLLAANPDVPVHAVTTAYTHRRRRRTHVQVRVSPPLPLDVAALTDAEILTAVRDALLALGGQTYVDASSHAVKARRQAAPPPPPS